MIDLAPFVHAMDYLSDLSLGRPIVSTRHRSCPYCASKAAIGKRCDSCGAPDMEVKINRGKLIEVQFATMFSSPKQHLTLKTA